MKYNYRQRLHDLNITLSQTGRQTCPKCSATRKNKDEKCLSVTFKSDAIYYKCHNSCGFTGIVNYSDKDFVISNKVYQKPKEPTQSEKNLDKLVRYFDKRCISRKTLLTYGVSINENNEMIFKYYKNGTLVNIKTRKNLGDGKKQFMQSKDSEKTFFGMDLIPMQAREVIIVEGEIDVLSYAEVGLYAISIPQGGSDTKLECIDNCYDFLDSFDNYIIAVDSDDIGKKLQSNLINRLGKHKCKTIDFELFDVKDANELLVQNRDDLKESIFYAKSVPMPTIETIDDIENNLINIYRHGYDSGLSTGWESLDNKFTIRKGYLMIVTGVPTRGKSFFVDNLLYNMTKNYNWKHFICSFENRLEEHLIRYMQFHTELNFSQTFKPFMKEKDVLESINYFRDKIYRVKLDNSYSMDDILENAEYAVKRYGVDSVVIDPYNKMKNIYDGREDKYIDSILSEIQVFARRNNVLAVFIAHPTKMYKSKDDDGIPNMYSISGGASWYNMADYGIVIHRNKDKKTLSKTTQIIVEKVKDFHLGDPSGGVVEMDYNYKTHKLEEKINDIWQ